MSQKMHLKIIVMSLKNCFKKHFLDRVNRKKESIFLHYCARTTIGKNNVNNVSMNKSGCTYLNRF